MGDFVEQFKGEVEGCGGGSVGVYKGVLDVDGGVETELENDGVDVVGV